MNIILSIKPKWAEKIYSGEKLIEWRKNFPKKKEKGDVVFIYETSPVKKITGIIKIECFFVFRQGDLEKINKDNALIKAGCLDYDKVKKYSCGKNIYGWYIKKTCKFKNSFSIDRFNKLRPPQSWEYTEAKIEIIKGDTHERF